MLIEEERRFTTVDAPPIGQMYCFSRLLVNYFVPLDYLGFSLHRWPWASSWSHLYPRWYYLVSKVNSLLACCRSRAFLALQIKKKKKRDWLNGWYSIGSTVSTRPAQASAGVTCRSTADLAPHPQGERSPVNEDIKQLGHLAARSRPCDKFPPILCSVFLVFSPTSGHHPISITVTAWRTTNRRPFSEWNSWNAKNSNPGTEAADHSCHGRRKRWCLYRSLLGGTWWSSEATWRDLPYHWFFPSLSSVGVNHSRCQLRFATPAVSKTATGRTL